MKLQLKDLKTVPRKAHLFLGPVTEGNVKLFLKVKPHRQFSNFPAAVDCLAVLTMKLIWPQNRFFFCVLLLIFFQIDKTKQRPKFLSVCGKFF